VKKFSEALEQDREFEFGGELFKYQYVHWSVLTAIVDGSGSNGKELSATENVQEIVDSIPKFIEPDGDERIRKLLSSTESPVPIGQVNALYEWLLEVTSGRPTVPPSPSEAGRGKIAPSSKEK
jgi:hypothetical protein